ncbi:MAG TPA: urate hydroxylase PuuD, partial [Gaiellaceae bacterium]|nr:urate hydroxylase PuuD [Gaiellaceae bacterium]
MDAEYLRDLADLLLRLLHVVAGIAWIGASFYFIRLDLGLRAPEREEDVRKGVGGEYWGVHGGGFYHSQKYKVAPPKLPEHLHWFKWEAYTTWLSGFA